jgi:hypothetical protein
MNYFYFAMAAAVAAALIVIFAPSPITDRPGERRVRRDGWTL